jgi:catechol 2,3-dioxygenase
MSASGTGFRPRKLGHANLYVGEIERSMTFYTQICGLEEVFREHLIKAGFVSNGTRHHDLGMVDISRRKLIGRDGEELGDRNVPSSAGLNHLAFEVETEKELVASFKKVEKTDTHIVMTLDHGLAKSVYLTDPSGMEVEFYSDAIDDWREFFNNALKRNAMVTGLWEPGKETPSEKSYFEEFPEVRVVPDAALNPISIVHATMSVVNFEDSLKFHRDIGGFSVVAQDDGIAVLKGYQQPLQDVVLVRSKSPSEGNRIHHLTFAMPTPEHVQKGKARLAKAGVQIVRELDTDRKTSLFIRDPDDLLLEFAHYKVNAPVATVGSAPEDAFLV